MAVFVELVTDAFQDVRIAAGIAARSTGRAGSSSVRRPMRGIEIKEDTYGILRVVRSDGSEVPMVDSGSSTGKNSNYANFLIQSVSEPRIEKHQIVETFGEAYIMFFGEAPRFLDVRAALVCSNDFNWLAEWWENYDRFLRGTKCVENGARCYLMYDDNIVEGYMISSDAVNTSDSPYTVNMQFRMFLTGYQNISLLNGPNFPVRAGMRKSDGSTILMPDKSGDLVSLPTNPNDKTPLAGGFDPTTGNFLVQNKDGSSQPASITPIRNVIASNIDEWTGEGDYDAAAETGAGQEEEDPLEIDDELEEESFLQRMSRELRDLGVANNLDSMQLLNMGMGPAFGYGSSDKSAQENVMLARMGFDLSPEGMTMSTALSDGKTTTTTTIKDTFSGEHSEMAETKPNAPKAYGGVQTLTPTKNGYIVNSPLPPGQSGVVTGMALSIDPFHPSPSGNIGKASSFSVVSLPGEYAEEYSEEEF